MGGCFLRNPVKEKLVKDWLFFAKENLLFAKAGMKEDFSPFHTICFLCQGSAEKYLKAFLLWNGWKLKKTHDMSELVELCCEYDKSFEQLFSECELLNEYVSKARYPNDLSIEHIGEKQAKEAIEAAEKIETNVMEFFDILYISNKINKDNEKANNASDSIRQKNSE